ncbi:MAG: ferritin family protein [Alphaproteobacteria bacterium]|jgi:rubrerythrin|nr:ferritin family protein [Alphaproteobacteria bacterium]HJP20835.1 ferritin family protein [Alphaproteobacteria bacterium]
MSAADRLAINDLGEFLAHAGAMEREATERYEELASQMEVHNNPEVAELFAKMAEIEKKHVDKIDARSSGVEVPHVAPWEYKWEDPEGPETAQTFDAHYLMTPYHALQMALKAEQKAAEFFDLVASRTSDEKVREMATEMASEEREHVELVRQWLARYPKPENGWDEDLDPPTLPD